MDTLSSILLGMHSLEPKEALNISQHSPLCNTIIVSSNYCIGDYGSLARLSVSSTMTTETTLVRVRPCSAEKSQILFLQP